MSHSHGATTPATPEVRDDVPTAPVDEAFVEMLGAAAILSLANM